MLGAAAGRRHQPRKDAARLGQLACKAGEGYGQRGWERGVICSCSKRQLRYARSGAGKAQERGSCPAELPTQALPCAP